MCFFSPKKSLHQSPYPRKVTAKISNPKKSSDRKFQPQSRASIIPVTIIPEYPLKELNSCQFLLLFCLEMKLLQVLNVNLRTDLYWEDPGTKLLHVHAYIKIPNTASICTSALD